MRALLLAAGAAAALALGACGGDDPGDEEPPGGGARTTVTAPTTGIADLEEAARAAGCEVMTHADEGDDHTAEDVRYRTNPPTSGPHDPQWAEDGLYPRGTAPDLEQSVHALEHGRINIQYKPSLPAERIAQLESLAEEEVKGSAGYHTLLFQNQTGMTADVAATAWRRSLVCARMGDGVFDAIRAFRTARVDKGPEFVP